MHIDIGALGVVFVVSFGAAVAVIVLVSLALVGLSARVSAADAALPGTVDVGTAPITTGSRPSALSPAAGTVLAVVCLAAAAAIVLFGLYIIVA